MQDKSPEARDALFFNPDYHQLIGLIYDAVSGRGGFFPFLKRFVEVFNGHSGSFAIYDTRANKALGYWVVNIPDSALAFYVEHVAHQDALVATAMAAQSEYGPRFVASNLDIDNMEEVRATTRAGEWLESYGAWEAAGAIVYRSDHYLTFFGIQRSRHQPLFTRDELVVFNMFLPHISRAVELYTKMSAFDLGSNPERAALNQVKRGILICNASFRVIFRNTWADEVIANNPRLWLDEEGMFHLRDKDVSWELTAALSDAVRGSLESSAVPDRTLCYRQGSQNIIIVVSPLSSHARGEAAGSTGGAMITLYDWASRPSVDADLLQRFFNLSRMESRVAALLLQGMGPTAIAEELNRSRETIKSHLQSIYRKTQTSRQGELVALLAASSGFA